MGSRPRKESQDRSGCSDGVAKIEMVGRGIIEIDGTLNEPQPEQADIEIKRPLRIAGDGRDVMKAHGEWPVPVPVPVGSPSNRYRRRSRYRFAEAVNRNAQIRPLPASDGASPDHQIISLTLLGDDGGFPEAKSAAKGAGVVACSTAWR